jgi:hypothetical protein
LIKDHANEVLAGFCSFAKSAKGTSMENQFSQKRRYVNDAAVSRQRFRDAWLEVEGSHRYQA